MAGCCFAQDRTNQKQEEVYGVGFMKNMFANVDLSDATAAIKVYIDELQRKLAVGYKLKAVIFDDTDELLRSFYSEKVVILNIGSIDFLQNRSRLPVSPYMVGSLKDSPLDEYVILVRNDGKINDIAELTNQIFEILPRANNPLPNMWLDILLSKHKLNPKEKLFKSISENPSESKMIMSVFFKLLDACLVTKNAFITMNELNPQIGKQLKILAMSPGYLRALSCFSNSFMKSTNGKNLYEGSQKAISYPAGRQLFTLMRTDRIVPYKEEYLGQVKNLLSEYNSLQKKQKK